MQVANSTSFDRYAESFALVASLLDAEPDSLRILSFGSSTGLECFALRRYFPEAAIVGVDVDDGMVEQAVRANRDDRIRFLASHRDDYRRFGPFDAIFAMSVLCRYPESNSLDRLDPLYPFAEFEAQVSELADQLTERGVLAVSNASYGVGDTQTGRHLQPILCPSILDCGFVDRFRSDGSLLARTARNEGGFYFRFLGEPDEYDDARFRAVAWSRANPPRSAVSRLEPKFPLEGPAVAERVTSPFPIDSPRPPAPVLDAGAPVTHAARRLRVVASHDGTLRCATQGLRRRPDGTIDDFGWRVRPIPLDLESELS